MLTENNKLENAEHRIICVIKGWCAYDPETEASLRRSNGRAKAGQRSRYYLDWEGHELKVFKAFSDLEAVEMAVKHMNKLREEG